MMLMSANGFLLHYVGSLRWDLEIFEKEWKKKCGKKINSIWMMLMIVNGFLLHYVGSLQWDIDILRKEMKPKKEKKRKRIQFDLNDANECEWFTSSLCRFTVIRLRNCSEKNEKKYKIKKTILKKKSN